MRVETRGSNQATHKKEVRPRSSPRPASESARASPARPWRIPAMAGRTRYPGFIAADCPRENPHPGNICSAV